MFNQRRASRKQRTVVLEIEPLEDRISPASVDTSNYGSRNPPTGAPYNMNQVYTDNLPPGHVAAEYAQANNFTGAYQPVAYFTALTEAQFQVNLEAPQDQPVSETFINTLQAWNRTLQQANQWNIPPVANADPVDDLTFTVNSYQAYGNAFQSWGGNPNLAAGTIAPMVGAGIDVRVNLPAPANSIRSEE